MAGDRILVTGSAGFIGSAFVRCLLNAEPETQVCSYDLLTYAGHEENLQDLPGADRHTFVKGDIADAEAVAQVIADFQPTALVNIAAETHVDRSIVDPMPFAHTNVMGAQILLSATREAGIRMLHVSTDEVYGSLEPPDAATPEYPLRPSNPYAASKVSGDLLVQAAWRTHDQDVLITRCTNNYGPRQTPEKLIPVMLLRAQAGEPLPVYGDGAQIREWVHVDDHARGLLATLRHGKTGGLYHFAGGTSLSNLEIVRRICDLVGASHDLITHVEDRPGHDRRYALDDSATREELGWAPETAFEDGLAATVAWYREHPAWCEAVAGEDLRAFLDTNYEGRTP